MSSSSSSSSSSSEGCPDLCEWALDEFAQWQLTCFGCNETSFCREPGSGLGVVAEARTATLCEPYGDPFPSSSSGRAAFSAKLAVAAPPQAMLRVPSVSDPKTWKTIAVSLAEPWRVVQLPKLGWIITILAVPAGPALPHITPVHAPVDDVEPADRALSASIVLPEQGGYNQYWIPVLEKYRWATLDTLRWRVMLVRTALPQA